MTNEVKSKNKSNKVAIIVFICLGTLILICAYPEYVSMQREKWRHEVLPFIFFTISKKYKQNNQGISLTDDDKRILTQQFHRLNDNFYYDTARRLFIPILETILKQQKYIVDNKIDVAMIFSQIDSAVSAKIDSLKVYNKTK